jgi:PKD repeat protein
VGEKVTFRYTSYYFWGFGFKTWNFGDGAFGWGSVVTHTYNKKGSYIVTLTVANGEDYGYSSHEIKIGASPFPKFTYLPNEPKPGENVYFDASESRDINGEIIKYNWSYTESKDPNKINQMGSNISFTYNWNEQGIYKVKLAVTDDDGNSNQITKTIAISILRIDAIKGGFRNLDFQITNRGNITAENIQWKVYANRLVLFLPLWKIFSKTGTISMLQPGQSKSIDIGRYRRGLGRISITVIVEGSNSVRITKSFQGFIFSKFIRTRS